MLTPDAPVTVATSTPPAKVDAQPVVEKKKPEDKLTKTRSNRQW